MPRRLDFGVGKIIEIVYDAAGAKLTKTVKQGTTTLLTQNYVAGIEYRNTGLDAIYHAEGRLTPNGTAFFYEYTIRDHLGNSRISFRANGGAAQVIQVEPRPSAGAKSRTPYR